MRDTMPSHDILKYYELYESEYYSISYDYLGSQSYLISKDDYLLLSKRIGDSSEDAPVYNSDFIYTVIHSSDPEATEAWLLSEFSDLDTGYEYMKPLLTPEDMFQRKIESDLSAIIGGLITIAVLLVLMSVCMYFIMRSALMNRIREVGIYRAIGVSKKNLVFKFFVEALVLTTLTVLLGYLATSAFIFVCLNLSPLVASIFFYPIWMALLVLAVLYALSLVCGTIPILSLLRKTPSEILAKYDI